MNRQDNAELRKQILARRSALPQPEYQRLSRIICTRITETTYWQSAAVVLCYVPFRNEVDIAPLIELAWQEQKLVLVPRCVPQTHRLLIKPLGSWQDLEDGIYGLREPSLDLPEVDPKTIDLILMPGSVYSRSGARLGYGAGYYDRFLPLCREETVRLAPHFAFQLVDELWQGFYDQSMDVLLNENELLHTERRGSEE